MQAYGKAPTIVQLEKVKFKQLQRGKNPSKMGLLASFFLKKITLGKF